MRQVRFEVERAIVGNFGDSAYVGEGEDPAEAMLAEAWRSLGTDVNVTVGGVTMFAAAWADPEHWASDWAEKLGVDYDDAPEAVAALLAAAVEESG